MEDRESIINPPSIVDRQSFSGIPGSVIRRGSKILKSFSGGRTLWARATSLTVLPVEKDSLAILATASFAACASKWFLAPRKGSSVICEVFLMVLELILDD